MIDCLIKQMIDWLNAKSYLFTETVRYKDRIKNIYFLVDHLDPNVFAFEFGLCKSIRTGVEKSLSIILV